jgi:hypothetical protein
MDRLLAGISFRKFLSIKIPLRYHSVDVDCRYSGAPTVK